MTAKWKIRLENVVSGVLIGSLLLCFLLYFASFAAGPGGEITPINLVEWIGWLCLRFAAPAGWLAERFFHNVSGAGFVLAWLECVVVSWLLITTCRFVVVKWRES
jgi:hypothetical protein